MPGLRPASCSWVAPALAFLLSGNAGCALAQDAASKVPRLVGQDDPPAPIKHAPPAVSLAGVLVSKALLVVHGGALKAVGVGETHLGVKVLEIAKDHVLVEHQGQRIQVRTGEAPLLSQANAAQEGGATIVLSSSYGGHYRTSGQINGRYVDFLVDTGASVLGMSIDTAKRLGIDYLLGQPIKAQSATAIVSGYLVQLDTVRVGSVTVRNVEAFVSDSNMRQVLLGNSFLSRFDIQQSNGQMLLTRRY